MDIQVILQNSIEKAFSTLYDQKVNVNEILIQKTKKEFQGDFTFNVFPYLMIYSS